MFKGSIRIEWEKQNSAEKQFSKKFNIALFTRIMLIQDKISKVLASKIWGALDPLSQMWEMLDPRPPGYTHGLFL